MGRSAVLSVQATLLEAIPLFAGLPGDDRVRVTELVDDVSVEAGTSICRERDFSYHFYAIVEGVADVLHDGRTLAALGPGDFFGEIGMLTTGRRTATVVAREPMRLVALFDQAFRRLEAEIPQFSIQVRAAVADRGWSIAH
jgi:CRP-like cAMP-binding protein